MVCKKCGAPMEASDGVCKICGTPLRKGKRLWPKHIKLAVVGVVLFASVVFVVLYTQGRINFDFLTSNYDPQNPQTPGELYENGDNYENIQGPQIPNEDNGNLTILRDEETRLELLQEVHQGVMDYMNYFDNQLAFISGAGHLQIWQDQDPVFFNPLFVTPQSLADAGFLSEEHLQEERHIFLIRPIDFLEFEEIDLPTSNEMTVFVGHETVVGIGLYSIYGYHEVFRENLNQILASYTPRNWYEDIIPPQRPGAGHPMHQQATAIISSLMNGESVDIRYMAFDEEFAFVAASANGQSHIMRYFLFAVENDDLSLLVHGFENVRHPIQAINQAAPNMILHLLPPWEMGTGNRHLLPPDHPSFAQITTILQMQGHIQPELSSQPMFAAATENFAYMVFSGGGLLLANQSAGWVLQNTVGWQEANARLWELAEEGQVPPLYILRQD